MNLKWSFYYFLFFVFWKNALVCSAWAHLFLEGKGGVRRSCRLQSSTGVSGPLQACAGLHGHVITRCGNEKCWCAWSNWSSHLLLFGTEVGKNYFEKLLANFGKLWIRKYIWTVRGSRALLESGAVNCVITVKHTVTIFTFSIFRPPQISLTLLWTEVLVYDSVLNDSYQWESVRRAEHARTQSYMRRGPATRGLSGDSG